MKVIKTGKYFNMRAEFFARVNHSEVDFSDAKDQENVKRALEIAAAGEPLL